MNLFILSQYKLIQELYKNDDFFEILINIDDFFDIINLYVFPNWLSCEVVDVDFLKYFTCITLKSPYNKMPHPKGSSLLVKYDCQVKYRETYEYIPKEVKSVEDTYVDKFTGERKPKAEKRKVWLIDIMIPNRLIINDNVFDLEGVQNKIRDDRQQEENMMGEPDDASMDMMPEAPEEGMEGMPNG